MNDEKTALIQEFWKYREKVYYYVYSRVFRKDNVEDIVSDIFVKICAKAETYDPSKAAMSTWIYTIAHNTVVDYAKKKRIDTSELDPNLADTSNPVEDVLRSEQSAMIMKALQKLPERSRDILLLKYFDGYNATQIAEKMGLSSVNVRTILLRAIQNLRKYIEPEA